MEGIAGLLAMVQFFFAVVIGLYFWNQLRSQQSSKATVERESEKQMEKLRKMRRISLAEPLAEKTRPQKFQEIVGQKEGLKALRAALCGPNPQHVIIYGPPGIGKTAAARVVLEEAKNNPRSPFGEHSEFVEIDSTTARFDERGIADPLIGTVHDPIYQGAGAMGIHGIPQPKPGAVSKAHGGVLFLDEIGELHHIQMNKLLKVLEDRKVFLESSYYSSEDPNCPQYIHEIFQKGLPADFRLIGATTKGPESIPEAIRSRCVEVFFKGLTPEELVGIAKHAVKRLGFEVEQGAIEIIKKYAENGREAVNLIQIAAGLAQTEKRSNLTQKDLEWVINTSQISPRPDKLIPARSQVGLANALAVLGPSRGTLLEIEVSSIPCKEGEGEINVTGLVEEEEMGGHSRVVRRKSMAKGSVDNVLTVLKHYLDVNPRDYDIHINFPGSIPIDGPSAGVAIATAIYSSLSNKPIDHKVAMTGEVSIRGEIKPVGGVSTKIEAAKEAQASKVLIPKENYQKTFEDEESLTVSPVEDLKEVLREVTL
ncbi:ATP-dependent protease LonB [Natranaerobius thermophilus]|uniref:endopeptidase La n=1 Tax=Natranaerobius thermophilus (strain ATCC BAA-1301 / DSM 18059 / JW/NM-WN-LF) TaxID=457570 RepID=B2A1E7_NATTJ|nr:ATP-dependent protease LonB [Natranaerobius thermophilus]ACB84687.1 ATP-dependent protease LonB [Natranaerobius thermophilus JW/NM-WN-LF]